ncbi:MAG: glycoside hydrolase family 2 [Oxalobacteraceae bacterium]|mgnify:CR=1 FL=1|nr:MAG: glycoside hydrolase family 2 [Oxalobacteraceae bacterium]
MADAYPRPQLVRPNWTSLNGPWKFTFDNEQRFDMTTRPVEWTHQINVPFPPESPQSGINDRGFHLACWYQREFDCAPGNDRVMLHFGAVDYKATVWVNGHRVAIHEGGHSPFAADITSALLASGKQTVTVYAEDDPHDLAKPRGKQDWQLEAHSIWYPRTTGIWQAVWVERVPRTFIHKLQWTPHFENFEIGCAVYIQGDPEDNLSVEVEITHGDKVLASDMYKVIGNEAHRKIGLSDPGIDDSRNELLWCPERPTLLDARVTLRRGDVVLDEITSYTAMRSVAISRDRFMLNGRPYHLRLVLDQGYWDDSLMTAPSDDALRRDVELAKEMGFNGVRKHQKIEDPRYLYWADKLGLMVWEEMPSAYRFTSKAITRMVQEWTEVIDRDYSHPCIVVWVPFNESWGVPNLMSTQSHRNAVEALYHLTRTLDSTRPVIGNDGWEAAATDIIGIHDYDPSPEKIRARYNDKTQELFDRRRPGGRILTLDGYPHRGQPIMLTEFGGIACVRPQQNAGTTWGYSTASEAAEFADKYRKLLAVVNTTTMFSGFCYTQFTDTFQEANGLLYADRTPKFPIEQIAAATRATRYGYDGNPAEVEVGGGDVAKEVGKDADKV